MAHPPHITLSKQQQCLSVVSTRMCLCVGTYPSDAIMYLRFDCISAGTCSECAIWLHCKEMNCVTSEHVSPHTNVNCPPPQIETIKYYLHTYLYWKICVTMCAFTESVLGLQINRAVGHYNN